MEQKKADENMKTGLVLEGGAMRGIYTAGVLDVFLEQGIAADGVIGVSAGAIHGCCYVSRQHGRSIRYYSKYCGSRNFMSLYSLITTGNMVNVDFCYRDLPETLDPFDHTAFEQSDIDFYVTCSSLRTGEARYILCKSLRGRRIDYLRASASMPYVSKVVEMGEEKFLDGGVCDSIPAQAFLKLGYRKQIVVLTRCAGYRKPASGRLSASLYYKEYPQFMEALNTRAKRYNATLDWLEEQESAGRIFIIRPTQDLHVRRAERDVEKIRAQYGLGRQDALNRIEELKLFLKNEAAHL